MAQTSWKGGSVKNGNDDEVPITQLEKALDLLGEKGKKSQMTYFQSCSQIKTTNGYIQLEGLEPALESLFGEASNLIMKIIKTTKN